MSDPYSTIRSWAPHVLMLGLIAIGIWLIAMVFQPLLISLLLSASIASLTYLIIYQPVLFAVQILGKANLSPLTIRQIAGVIATVIMVVLIISPVLLLVAGALGSFAAISDTFVGIIMRDPERMKVLLDSIEGSLRDFNDIYPTLAIPDETIASLRSSVGDIIREARDFGPNFMRFLFAGSGYLAQYILAFISLAFFYAHGPRLINAALRMTPLNNEQIIQLKDDSRAVIINLLTDTIGLALARGILLASIARLCNPDFNPVLIAVLAAFLSLLPVVGFSLVWLPLVWISWQKQHYISVAAIGTAGLLIDYGLHWVWSRFGHRVSSRSSWLSFGLFLGLIGGLLSFGPKGFVIGPMAVVFTSTMMRFWLPIYGVASDQIGDGDTALLLTPPGKAAEPPADTSPAPSSKTPDL